MARKIILPFTILTAAVLIVLAMLSHKEQVTSTLVNPASVGRVQGASPRLDVAVPRVKAAPTTSIELAKHQWDELRASVRVLDSTDQTGLTALYEQAHGLIRSDESAMSKALAQSMPVLVNVSLEESFFSVSAWIRSSTHPTDVIEAIFNYDAPVDSPTADVHHVPQTAAVRYERIAAYSLKELRSQITKGNLALSVSAQKNLVEILVPRAAHEQSLNLALEMFQLLASLNERAGIQTALAGHSKRDRQIIQSVLSSR